MLRSLQPPSGWEGGKERMEYSDSNLMLQSQSTFYPGKTNGLFHHEMNTHILSGGHERCSNEHNCSGKCEIALAWNFFFFNLYFFCKAFHADLRTLQWWAHQFFFPLAVNSPVCRHSLINIPFPLLQSDGKSPKIIICLFSPVSIVGKRFGVHWFIFVSPKHQSLCIQQLMFIMNFCFPKTEMAPPVKGEGENSMKRNRMPAYKIVLKSCYQKSKRLQNTQQLSYSHIYHSQVARKTSTTQARGG